MDGSLAGTQGDLSVALVERIKNGDSSAFDALYLRYRDRLLFSIRCRLGPALRARVDSEDILHSVVRDAMRDLAGFQHRGEGSLSHYLHVCVLSKIRAKATFFGAKKRRGEVALSDSVLSRIPGRAEGAPRYVHAAYDKLERAIARLPEEMREVLILRKIEQLGNEETARSIGKSPEATSKIYNRALARLGLLMRHEEPA